MIYVEDYHILYISKLMNLNDFFLIRSNPLNMRLSRNLVTQSHWDHFL